MIRFKKKFAAVALIFLLLFLLIIKQPSLFSSVRMQAVDMFEIPLKFSSAIIRELKNIVFFGSILRENARLKKEVDKLNKQLADSQEALSENKRFEKLLSFKNESPFTTIAARVMAKESSSWSSAIIIDKGKADGVRPDMVVVTDLGLVGKVSEVGNSTSKVVLINDANLNVAALIQRSREQGAISGTVAGGCKMRYLSSDSDVQVGDKVATSGLGDIFPKGILIGDVSEIGPDTSGLMKFCLVRPAVNLSRLEEVLVITEK